MIGFNQDYEAAPAASGLQTETAAMFRAGGWINDSLGLEHRPQQEKMACALANALDADDPLLFEAGTGVGKSLAYLLPCLLHAIKTERPCIVSTHTISLQEQIQNKDLDLCRALFDKVPELAPYRDFRAALLMGKGNYLCSYRLSRAIETRADLFGSAEQTELERLAEWSQHTRNGLLQELSPAPPLDLWDLVNADSSVCNRKNCSPENCPYQRARSRLHRAHLIVVNHSLLFALINATGGPEKGRGVLYPNDFVVIDEAHTVPAIATEHFGLSLGSVGLTRLLNTLYHPAKKRGLLARYGGAREARAVEDVAEAAKQFFDYIRAHILHRSNIVRLRHENWAEPTLLPPLRALVGILGDVAGRLEEGPAQEELNDAKSRLQRWYAGLNQCLGLSAEDHVHWVERTGRKGQNVALRNAPIDVAPCLREALFRRKTSVVLTSATLAPAGNMPAFQAQVGAENTAFEIVYSPFDYERNFRVFLAVDVPAPSVRDGKLALDILADYIRFCAGKTPGGSLVLFTSYQDMRQVASQTERDFRSLNRPFFLQGRDFSRTEITRRFAAAGNGVLFGTESFWTGVDVPGDALSQVIIARLPFENPSHPIPEAKCEWIRERGGNPFNAFTLPQALVRFRQGVGRLIRNRTDRGIVTVLDSRVTTKPYGRLFLDSLPRQHFEKMTRENRDERFRPFPLSK